MTIHYHGTPITPRKELLKLIGRHFCVSFAQHQDIEVVHKIGQSVMIDNGAYTLWKQKIEINWITFYEWVDKWLDYPTTWSVIPDIIGGSEEDNDQLIKQWPHKNKGFPVWHLHESINRLLNLINKYEKVCFGSSDRYSEIGTKLWHNRIRKAFFEIQKIYNRIPWIHMLRGMSCCNFNYPFASLDSTDLARNHHLKHNIVDMAARWDGINLSPNIIISTTKGFFDD